MSKNQLKKAKKRMIAEKMAIQEEVYSKCMKAVMDVAEQLQKEINKTGGE